MQPRLVSALSLLSKGIAGPLNCELSSIICCAIYTIEIKCIWHIKLSHKSCSCRRTGYLQSLIQAIVEGVNSAMNQSEIDEIQSEYLSYDWFWIGLFRWNCGTIIFRAWLCKCNGHQINTYFHPLLHCQLMFAFKYLVIFFFSLTKMGRIPLLKEKTGNING